MLQIKSMVYDQYGVSAGLCLFDPVFVNDWWGSIADVSPDLCMKWFMVIIIPVEVFTRGRRRVRTFIPAQISPLMYSYNVNGAAVLVRVQCVFSLLLVMSPPFWVLSREEGCGYRYGNQSRESCCASCVTLHPSEHVPFPWLSSAVLCTCHHLCLSVLHLFFLVLCEHLLHQT